MTALTSRWLRFLVLLPVLIGFVQVLPARGQPAPNADLKKLLGTWEGFAVEGKGDNPDRGPVHVQLTITEGKMSAIDLGKDKKDMGNGTFTLDASGPVKQMDAKGVLLPGKRERTFLGIYELDGDTLRWCVDNRQQGRPTEFRTGSGNFLMVLKRKK